MVVFGFELSALRCSPASLPPSLYLQRDDSSSRTRRKKERKTELCETRDARFVAPLLVLVRAVETWSDLDGGRELVQPATLSQHLHKTNPVST